ncbi:MAG: 16S rRNA (adenine(1518)-N(6)/adenine(1519)-N(6))-dimethyltransferase RsmA [Acholeplasmatales bacterium]|nr:16S rRNA (adenine(1518)-N(6)/adenine(1519)-N(6))-dimethyltransferase RsmA [Acholeplasmatales bacterium]
MQAKVGNKSYINKQIEDADFKIKKKFGQNFLTDQNILTEIIDAADLNNDVAVIEIGPGLGSLTERLVSKAGFVLCYEIDKEVIPLLEKNLSGYNNYDVINKDILDVNINEDIEKYLKDYKNIYVVANLPYYITTPIILGLLSKTDKIDRYVMMMQKEVADRICGKPSTKDYNALSIAIQYRTDAKKITNVPRTVFIPAPNVDSAIIRLDKYKTKVYEAKNEEFFFEFIRLCFSQRRKTLINNLSAKFDKQLIIKMLNHFNIKENVRSEELGIKDFINLCDYIVENEGF